MSNLWQAKQNVTIQYSDIFILNNINILRK